MLPVSSTSASAPVEGSSGFAFGAPTTSPEYACFSHKDKKERWQKWGQGPRLLTTCLPLVQGGRVSSDEEDSAFLLDFFNSPHLRALLHPLTSKGTPTTLKGAVTRVDFSRLSVVCTSLSLFDALIPSVLGVSERQVAAAGAGGGGGPSPAAAPAAAVVWIRRRLEEPWEGVTIADNLREALVLPPEGDPEGVDPSGSAECLQQPNRFTSLFSQAQRREFLWRAAKFVVCGGPMSQHEDEWTPYAAAIKDIARDFLTVVKGKDGGVSVATVVWQVRGLEGLEREGGESMEGGGGLFAADSPHNVCWVFYDPIHRCCHILHSSFVPFW
jgi:hypothetical protein